ncbi:MAG: ABC transporter substrate-binding protein [Desulfuromonas sp.]|uniref:ABC transporter substrate-binding protein n=1 Tax=Desulfuromonas thiophila TaxID=57664 RepID=UPI0024A7D040|nr:cobalamin-binding protein [Desulfuromonas thiophila]MDD3801021.1 cobalamin-binding protein [Desulfuromonas thiophila]
MPSLSRPFLIWWLLALLWLPAAVAAAPLTLVDDLGRRVELAGPACRILSLVPSVTETLFALGAGGQLVGRTDFCTYPPAALQLPSVGAYDNPNLEAVLLRRPDLVILSADMSNPAALARFEALRLPVYIVYPRSLDGVARQFEQLGRLCGREAAAAELGRRFAAVRQQVARQAPVLGPRVLLCVMVEPLIVAGDETLMGEMLRLCGGRNVAPGQRFPQWNVETLLQADPQLILVSAHPGQPRPETFFERWPVLQAVRQGRLVQLEADWLQRPGPRLIEGLQALAAVVRQAAPVQP